jgi:hypothetical protein
MRPAAGHHDALQIPLGARFVQPVDDQIRQFRYFGAVYPVSADGGVAETGDRVHQRGPDNSGRLESFGERGFQCGHRNPFT